MACYRFPQAIAKQPNSWCGEWRDKEVTIDSPIDDIYAKLRSPVIGGDLIGAPKKPRKAKK